MILLSIWRTIDGRLGAVFRRIFLISSHIGTGSTVLPLVALVFLHERFWTQLFQCKFSLICCLGDNIKMIQLSHSLLVPAATRKTTTGNNFIFRTVLCKMRFLFALKIETSYCTLSSPRVDSTMIWNWYWGVWLLENCIETLLLDSFDIFIYYHHRWK